MSAFAQARRPASRIPPVPVAPLGLKRGCGCAAHGASCPARRDALSRPAQAALRQARFVANDDDSTGGMRVRAPLDARGQGVAHDFTHLPVTGMRDTFDGHADDEGSEAVNARPGGGTSSGTQLPPVARPSGTRVDTTTSFTQAALQAGYLSGMGIIARMQVLPDSTTWDGGEVVESVQQTSSSCPDSLTQPGPCNGHSHFPIGGAMRGRGVRPAQPAVRNRFYDIHTSESRSVSFLHDPARNPAGLNSCDTVCRQDYSYGGFVIGSHSISRHFRKGVHAGRDVTIIDVTKTDIPQGPGDFPARTLPAGQEYAGGAGRPATGVLA